MDKYQNVFARFVEFESQYNRYLIARRNKRYTQEVLNYTANLEENIIDSMNHLIWHDYKIEGAHEFYEYYPKKRIITSWPFKYRVVNCAAYNILWPIYSKSFYEHSYGSIPKRGQVMACNQLQQWMRNIDRKSGAKWWVGKADIAKFFFRIPHEIQLRELGKPLDDPEMMWFLETCIKGDGKPTGIPLETTDVSECERIFGIGMPVGSLISQMTANVVLSSLDHYIKRTVRAPYYIRYMDDMIIMAPSKQQTWDIIGAMDDYLNENLGLQLNNKTAIMPYDAGPEFIGKRVWPDRITIRKSTSLRIKQHLNYVRKAYSSGEVSLEYALSVITSYNGMLKHTSSTALRNRIIEDYILVRKSER